MLKQGHTCAAPRRDGGHSKRLVELILELIHLFLPALDGPGEGNVVTFAVAQHTRAALGSSGVASLVQKAGCMG